MAVAFKKSVLSFAGVIALTAATVSSAAAQSLSRLDRACIEYVRPSSEADWRSCESVAQKATLRVSESAVAYFHAAEWTFNNAATSEVVRFENATRLARESLNRLPAAAPSLWTVPEDITKRRRDREARIDAWLGPRQRFVFDRTVLLGQSYFELAKVRQQQGVSLNEASDCRTKDECIEKGLSALNANGPGINVTDVRGAVLRSLDPLGRFPAAQPTQNDGRLLYLRGELNALRDSLFGRREAIEEFRAIIGARVGGEIEQRARQRGEAIALSLGNDSLSANPSTRDLEDAIQHFSVALDFNPNSLNALRKKGDSALKLAQSGEGNAFTFYSMAQESFSRVANTQGLGQEELIDINQKLGDTAIAWADEILAGPAPTLAERNRAQALQDSAITYFERARQLGGGDPDMRQHLANAYAKRGSFKNADDEYRGSIAARLGKPAWNVPTGGEQSQSMITFRSDVAKLRTQDPTSAKALADSVFQIYQLRLDAKAQTERDGRQNPFESSAASEADILRAVEAADGARNDILLLLAREYLRNNDANAAITRLDKVIELTAGSAQPDDLEARAEAQFRRSRAELKKTRGVDTKKALALAESAARIDGGNAAYRTQACAADIIDGGRFRQRSQSLFNWCSLAAPGPEGQLLQGMFQLRSAQFATRYNDQIALRDGGQTLFRTGLDMISRAESAGDIEGLGDAAPSFDLRPQSGTRPSVKSLLEWGRAVAITCNGSGYDADLTPNEARSAQLFFDEFNLGGDGC